MLFVIDFKSIFVSAHLDRSLTIAKEEIEQHAQCTLGKQKSAATEVNYLPRNTFLSYVTLHVRYVMLCYVTLHLRHVTLCYVTLRHVMLRQLCYVTLLTVLVFTCALSCCFFNRKQRILLTTLTSKKSPTTNGLKKRCAFILCIYYCFYVFYRVVLCCVALHCATLCNV